MMTMITGSEAGISYSDPGIVEKRLIDIKRKLPIELPTLIILPNYFSIAKKIGESKANISGSQPFHAT
jgi:hypothetical protein